MKPAPIKHSSWVVGVQGDGKNRKYLLGKRAKGANNSGQWGFFGGTNDTGETPQEAGHREFREESGIPINHSLHMGTHKTKAKHNHFFLTHFPTEVEPKNLDKKETEKHAWRTRSQIRRMNLHSSAQIYFHKILPAKLAAKAAKRRKVTAKEVPMNDPEGHYEHHGIKYDQANGLGQVPFNQEVNYRGFSVHMKPSQFKKLAAPRNFDEDTNSLKHIQTAIQNGKPIGSPFLSVTFDPKHKKPALITGHEGRTRMEAIQKVHGDVPVLVHIFPGGGDRARHISAAHIQAFQQGAIPEKQTKVIAGPHFGDDVHHLGKWQDINQMKHKSHASTEFPEMEHIELKANHSHTGGRVKEYAVHTKRGRHLGTIYNSDLVDQPQTTWQALYKGKFTEHPSIEHAAVHIFKKAKPAKWEMKANVMKTIADDVPISNDHNEMAAHHLQKMQTAKSAMKAEPNVATHKTTYKYHKAMFNKHNNLYKMRLANKYSMKQIQQSHANTDVRNLEVDAGILDHAKAAYHIIKSNIHHDAATKHLGIYNKLKQNFTSDPGDAVEKKNAMAHHLSVFNAHKAMHKEHLNAYHKASNWRRLDRIEPTLDKPKTAAPKVTPENKSVAPAVETPPKKIGPKPYRPPAEPDTSKLKDAALHNTMIKYHEDAANNTTSGIGKRYHNEEIDKHKTALQNIKPKAVKLKPAAPVKPAEPVNTKNKQDADYEKLSSKEKKKHNDETIQYHNTMIKHHGDEIKKNVKKLAADPKNTKAAQAIEYHNAERKEFTDNVQKYHKANNDLADTPANEPDSDKANIKHHTTELRKHQALVKKHTKTVDGLKAALTDPDTAKDVKKKQRDALKEHNGHLKNAKHNVNHHAKILESYGVPDSKINPVAKQTEPKVAKPVQKAVPVKSAPVKAAPKSRYVQKTEPTPPPPPVKKKYKLKVVPQAVSTKRRNRAA